MPRIAREAFANTPLATESSAGDMSAADKAKLDAAIASSDGVLAAPGNLGNFTVASASRVLLGWNRGSGTRDATLINCDAGATVGFYLMWFNGTSVVTLLTVKTDGTLAQPAWTNVTFNLGTNLGGGYQTVQYRKNTLGEVELRGSATVGNNGVVFTLPAGYRPSAMRAFTLLQFGGENAEQATTVIGCRIDTGGNVVVDASAAGAVASFDGIRFSTD